MRCYIGIVSLLLSMGVSMSVARAATTDNLLPNVNDGVDWNSSSTDMINSGNSGVVYNGNTINGFTVTCPTQQPNCGYKYDIGGDFEVTGTATLSANNIQLYDETITQSMLDNGITLESNIDVANCESNQGNCESKGGANDSHTVTITLKDNTGDILSTVSQTRTEITGFQGNCNGYPGTNTTGVTADCGQYTDTMIFTGVGANNVDWSWTGVDNNYSNQSRQGPNLLGSSLVMTFEEFTLDLGDIDDFTESFSDIEQSLAFDFDDWSDEFEELYIEDSFDDFVFIEEVDLAYETIPFIELGNEFFFFDDFEDDADYDVDDVEMLPLVEEDELPFFLGDAEMILEDEQDFFEAEETMFVEMFEEEIETVETEEEENIVEEEITEFTEISEDESESVVVEEEITLTEATGEAKEGSDIVEVSSDTNITVEVREVVYKGIDKYLNDNIKKLDQILQNQVMIEDSVFYPSQNIYTDQVVFVDNRDIYQDIIVIDDPMTQYNNEMSEILQRKNKLKMQIEELKWK